MPRHRTRAALALAACLSTLAACKAELHHNLDERAANDMIVVLEQHGVQADKAPDSTNKEAWMVVVPSQSRVQAWSILKAEGLPRPAAEGFGKFYPSGGLIPTSSEEHVLLQYATAQELRRGLLTLDGVVDAHVNLVLPKKSRVRMSRDAEQTTRASILIKYRPVEEGKAPLTEDQIKRFATGGVEDLDPKDISVILSPEAHRPLLEPKLQQVGPIAVDGRSKPILQGVIALLVTVILLMGAGIGFLIVRRRGPEVQP